MVTANPVIEPIQTKNDDRALEEQLNRAFEILRTSRNYAASVLNQGDLATQNIADIVQKSIEVSSGNLQLVSDLTSPGNSKVYGTDGSGVKGWKNDPAGGSSLPVPDSTSIVTFGTDKEMRIDVGAIANSTVRVLTMPDQNIDLTPGTGAFALSGNFTFTTISDMVASTLLSIGDFVGVKNYNSGNESGILFFEIVGAGTGTADGGRWIDLDTYQAKANFNTNRYTFEQWGTVGDGSTDDSTKMQAAIDYIESIGGGNIFASTVTYAIATGLVIDSRGVGIKGGALAGGFHDRGGEPATTGFKWTGAAGGTILKVTAVSGSSNQSLRACSIKNIKFNANSPTHSNGSVTLDSGGSGSVDGITVNSVQIMDGAESFDTNLATTAGNIVANINAFTSSPNYYADVVGTEVIIKAAIRGTGPNGFVVVSSTTTIVTIDVNLASGVTDTSAAIGLEVISTSYCEFMDLGFLNFTDAGLVFKVIDTLGEARDTQHNKTRNIQWEHFNEIGACLRLEGDATANTSYNLFEDLSLKHFNGVGIDINNGDNNTFTFIGVFRVKNGAGSGIILRAGPTTSQTARYNNFIHWGVRNVIAEGTDVDTAPSHDNTMWLMDFGNGVQPAALGTNATVWTHSSRGIFIDHGFERITVAATRANAVAERANMVNETIRIHNSSSDHIRITNSTHEWGLNIDGSTGDLRFVRHAGSGNIEIYSGVTVDGRDISVDGTKLDLLTVTQAVDLDTMESDIATNNAKVTNATHTGDVTGSSGLTIASNAVSLSKMADMATASFIGRSTASTGDPQILSAASARSILNVENAADVTDTANVAAAGALMRSGGTMTGVLTIDKGGSDHLRIKQSTDEWGINIDGGTGDLRVLRTSGSGKFKLDTVNITNALYVDDVQVIRNRRTGWASTTGSEIRTNFGDADLAATSQALRALIVDAKAHGWIGA